MAQKINRVVIQPIKTIGSPLKDAKYLLNGSSTFSFLVKRKPNTYLFQISLDPPLFWTPEKTSEIPELPKNRVRIFVLTVSDLEDCNAYMQEIRKQSGKAEVMIWAFQKSGLEASKIDAFSLFEKQRMNFTVYYTQPSIDDIKNTASVLYGMGILSKCAIVQSHQDHASYARVVNEPQIEKIHEWYKKLLQTSDLSLFSRQILWKGMQRCYRVYRSKANRDTEQVATIRKDILDNVEQIVKETKIRRYWYETLNLFTMMKDQQGVESIVNILNLKSDFSQKQLIDLVRLCIKYNSFPYSIMQLVIDGCSDQRLDPKSMLVQMYNGRHHFYYENINKAASYFENVTQETKAPASAQYYLAKTLKKKLLAMLPPDLQGKKKLSLVQKMSIVPSVILEEMHESAKMVKEEFSQYLADTRKTKQADNTQQEKMLSDARKNLAYIQHFIEILILNLNSKDENEELSLGI